MENSLPTHRSEMFAQTWQREKIKWERQITLLKLHGIEHVVYLQLF